MTQAAQPAPQHQPTNSTQASAWAATEQYQSDTSAFDPLTAKIFDIVQQLLTASHDQSQKFDDLMKEVSATRAAVENKKTTITL